MKNAIATKEETKKNGGLLSRWDHPFFYSLHQEMNRLFEEFERGFGFRAGSRWLEPISDFHAHVDVKDTDKELVITAEVPGVEMKDIDVSITSDGLTIKGEKRAEKEEKDKGYYRMERGYGSFQRVVPLPCEVDRNSINATYKDGVVKVTLPKTKEAIQNTQKITVKAG